MPCPLPEQETKADSLRGEATHRARQKDVRVERALALHVQGERHSIIMQRLGITRPTLVKWLRDAGLEGNSVKPTQDKSIHGGRSLHHALEEREALANALTGGAAAAGAFRRARSPSESKAHRLD